MNKTAFSMTMKTMNGSPPLPYKIFRSKRHGLRDVHGGAVRELRRRRLDGRRRASDEQCEGAHKRRSGGASAVRREAVGQAVVEGVADQHRQLEMAR